MRPKNLNQGLEDSAVLRLAEVLTGVQQGPGRAVPEVPAAHDQVAFPEAVIDSRLATPGCLFVALRGERVDGHDFVAGAVARGARAALVRREQAAALALDVPAAVVEPSGAGLAGAAPGAVLLIAVDEPLAALHRLASYHRAQFAPTVIGITGSVGKTSSKEAVAAVLGRRYRTLKSPRSYNNESTLPLTLLQLDASHELAVLELGAYVPGDIALLAQLARPQIGLVTNVGHSHLERMGTLETVAHTKAELIRALPPTGRAILNIDDPRVRAMAEQTPARPFFYGLDPAADLSASQVRSMGLAGVAFRAHYQGAAHDFALPLLGRHSVYTALAAAAAGLLLGLSWEMIGEGLCDERARLRLVALPARCGATLIDDTYNAAPTSALAALELLTELAGRKIAVLGDMLELGAAEEAAHRQVGRRAAEVADLLLTVGRRARWIAAGAAEAGMPAARIAELADNQAAIERLRGAIGPGDVVLIKGSRGVAMEAIVAALRAES